MNYRNPYRYTGPLTPDYDGDVCISREAEIRKVCRGIRDGDYWTVLGPRQIGKTTFLNLLSKELSSHSHTCLYFNLEVYPATEDAFYEMMISEIISRVPNEIPPGNKGKWKNLGPGLNFFHFLKALPPMKSGEKIVFLMDEIGSAPYIDNYLHMWRKVHIERNHHRELFQFALVIAGADDIISLTMESHSSFNISRKLHIDNFLPQDAARLTDEPIAKQGLTWEENARSAVLTRTAGHPQQLQHLCYLLVEEAAAVPGPISTEQVDRAVEAQFKDSYNFNTLEVQVKNDVKLKHLLIRLLKGEDVKYLSFHKYSIAQSGPIVEDSNLNCQFRSPLNREYLSRILEHDEDNTPETPDLQPGEEPEFITTLYCEELPGPFKSENDEIAFLKELLRPRVKITIHKNAARELPDNFTSNEKLFLVYLAYKNYKAFETENISSWEDIPNNYKFRVSSKPENNENQVPEWDVFRQALLKEGTEYIGDSIRAWTHSLRSKLAAIDSRELIFSTTGRGSGYLLRGTVRFCKI